MKSITAIPLEVPYISLSIYICVHSSINWTLYIYDSWIINSYLLWWWLGTDCWESDACPSGDRAGDRRAAAGDHRAEGPEASGEGGLAKECKRSDGWLGIWGECIGNIYIYREREHMGNTYIYITLYIYTHMGSLGSDFPCLVLHTFFGWWAS